MVIYKTTNLVNGKIYVGKDCGRNKGYLGSGKILRKAIIKYGKENFKKEILEVCDLSNICEREIFWIKQLNARDLKIGYNLTDGGEGLSGYVFSPETLKKRSENNPLRGKHLSEEIKKKISATLTGRKLTKEHREKMSAAVLGRIVSEETRKKHCLKFTEEHKRKIAAANTGKRHTPEAIQKMRTTKKTLTPEQRKYLSDRCKANIGEKNFFFGHKHSEETKRKISESRKAMFKKRKEVEYQE